MADVESVKKDDFKKFGSRGLIEKGNNLQIIIGTSVQNLLNEIEKLID